MPGHFMFDLKSVTETQLEESKSLMENNNKSLSHNSIDSDKNWKRKKFDLGNDELQFDNSSVISNEIKDPEEGIDCLS